MQVNVQKFDDIREFAAVVEPFLLAHEAEHCLPLGILRTLGRQPNAWGTQPPYLALVEDGGRIVLVGLCTPPHNLILSVADPRADAAAAIKLIASDLGEAGMGLPGVLGPVDLARAFAEEWRLQSGAAYALAKQERIYRLDAVIPVSGIPGAPRRATSADRDLLVRWIVAFTDEAGPEPLDAEAWADAALASDPALRGTYVWEDGGEVVCLVGYSGPTPNGMRIGPVYTPPEHRGHGYASAATAAVSQKLLDGGRRFCFLFTDLANPTSNKIYQAIGYRPVVDVDMYRFGAAR